MADAGDSKSPAPHGHEGSTPSSGTSKPSLEAIDFTHEFLPSARRRPPLQHQQASLEAVVVSLVCAADYWEGCRKRRGNPNGEVRVVGPG